MTIEQLLITLVALLIIIWLGRLIARWSPVPFASILVALGFVISELVVRLGYDTGIRADSFQSLVFYVFIPLLVFDAAFKIDKQQLQENIIPILLLAVFGMVSTCVIASVVLFYGIGHAEGFPWQAALLTGSILAATDPGSIIARLRQSHTTKKLSVLLEGESLFNDAATIVLFALFMSLALAASSHDSSGYSLWHTAIEFVVVFTGGAVCGLVVGWSGSLLDRVAGHVYISGIITIIVAYGAYALAELLQVSGVMSTLLAGLFMSSRCSTQESPACHQTNIKFWSSIAYIASALLFIVVGVVITVTMFEQRWLAMVIAVLAVTVARAVSVYGGLSLLKLFGVHELSLRHQTVMVWSGVRGAVTLALALSLPVTLDYWWTIQSIAFGVVVFTLFVQATTIGWLLPEPDQTDSGQ